MAPASMSSAIFKIKNDWIDYSLRTKHHYNRKYILYNIIFFFMKVLHQLCEEHRFLHFLLRNTIVVSSIAVLDSRGQENQILVGVPTDNPKKKCSSVYPFCLRREGGREGKMNCVRGWSERKLRHYVSNAVHFSRLPSNVA